MHPAYSVILFTTASGAGYGLLALLALVGVVHGPATSFWFGAASLAVGLGLVSLGLLSSAFHLGRPERAWRAFSQWRSSWLSREGIAAVLTYAPAALFAGLWLGFIDAPVWIAPVGLVLIAMCGVTIYCTAKIYATLTTIRAWHQPLTVPVYFAFSLATGATLLMALAALFGRFQVFQAIVASAALLILIVLKHLNWRAIDTAAKTYTIEAATGLGRIGSDVRQWEVPHTSTNFVMKEMGYAVARKHGARLRRLIFGFLGIATVAAMLTPLAPVLLSVPAALAAGAAAIVERWLFFAQAQHVVTLYYGAKTA